MSDVLPLLLKILFWGGLFVSIGLARMGFEMVRDRRAKRRTERWLAPVLQQQRTLNDAVVTYVRGVFDGVWPAARRIKLTMGRRHRELDDVAIDSLVAYVTYQRRQAAPATGQ